MKSGLLAHLKSGGLLASTTVLKVWRKLIQHLSGLELQQGHS